MPDQIIRDIPLIRRYSRHNEAEDARFRLFLKTKLALSNDELDKIARETTDAVWRQIDCLSCGNCCKTLQIIVDDADIRRLAGRLNLTYAQTAKRFVRHAPDGAKFLKSSPCVFLAEDNRCAVYEDRPQACRDFPYLHDKGFRHRSLTMYENRETCPIVFNVWQRLKHRLWPKC